MVHKVIDRFSIGLNYFCSVTFWIVEEQNLSCEDFGTNSAKFILSMFNSAKWHIVHKPIALEIIYSVNSCLSSIVDSRSE